MDENVETKEIKVNEKKLFSGVVWLNIKALGLVLGLLFGLIIFCATNWLVIKGGEVVGPNLSLLEQYFIGYTVTVKGAFIAFGYSFFWGFLFGWLIAYLRNLFFAFYIYRVRKKAEMRSVKDFFDHI